MGGALFCKGGLYTKEIFFLRSQEKVTKDEGAKQDLMERQDSIDNHERVRG